MGIAYRLMRPQLTLQNILDIKSSRSMRLTTSPFGLTPEQYATNPPVYIAAAVPWKGLHGLDSLPPRVRAGLENAIRISKAAAGVRGTRLYNGKVYPAKCIRQMELAHKVSGIA